MRVDGVDVRDYDTEQLWSAIGLVPQRGYLFSGTVADNLRYGKADATDERDVGRVAGGGGRRLRPRPPRRPGDAGRAGRHQLLGRTAATTGDRARRDPPAGDLPVRRRVLGARRAHRCAGPRLAARGLGRRDGGHCVATYFDGRGGRPGRRRRRRPGRRHRHARDTAGQLPDLRRVRRLTVAWRRSQEATDDRRADGTPDPRRSAGADASGRATSRGRRSDWSSG